MSLQNRKDKKNDNSRRTEISTEIEIWPKRGYCLL